MKQIKIQNTYDIKLKGTPSETILTKKSFSSIGVSPSILRLFKPKLTIKKGETVEKGSPLFYSKANPKILFLSPVSGTISSIEHGHRHCIQHIIITPDATQKSCELPKINFDELNNISPETLINILLNSGQFGRLRMFPFNAIPNPTERPKRIYVSLTNDEPFVANTELLIDQHAETIKKGIQLLKRIAEETTRVSVGKNQALAKQRLANVIDIEVEGGYPANNSGVILYHDKQDESHNQSWTIGVQDLIKMVKTVESGTYYADQLISIGGPLAKTPQHIDTIEGAPINELTEVSDSSIPTRRIIGGVFTGRTALETDFISYSDEGITLCEEGKAPELLSFALPGLNKPSYSKVYLSALLSKATWAMNTCLNGGERACISCGHCPKVCPVDIQPQFLMKTLNDNDVEGAMEQGLFDCVECGLCSYVCPSKIELQDIFAESKNKLAKEVIQ